jgi:hypothetical protein
MIQASSQEVIPHAVPVIHARRVSRVEGSTVTDGPTDVGADLRTGWSGPSAALIPKLIVPIMEP